LCCWRRPAWAGPPGAYQSAEPRSAGARGLRALLQPRLSGRRRALRALSCRASRRSPGHHALCWNAVLFQELYRQDLLDTTFYANDGFLTGRHATEEDPKTRDRILAWPTRPSARPIGARPQPQRHRRPLCPRLGAQPQVHLSRHGGAGLWRRLPAGHQGQGRRRARPATGPGLCGRQAGGGGLRVRGGSAALALQAADRLCRHHRLEDPRAWRC
jgi:hypothetical protein